MCLAIVKPAKLVIPTEHLSNGWIANPDGAGFAYIERGKVKIRKGFMLLKDFLAAYSTASKKFKNSPFLIHFRIRSMGERNEENTHPFPINKGALIHNGTLDGTGAIWDRGLSDTHIFSTAFGEDLSFDVVNTNKPQFEEVIGGYNKIAMLYDDSNFIILNSAKGVWLNDVWYSNSSYAKRTISTEPLASAHHYMGRE